MLDENIDATKYKSIKTRFEALNSKLKREKSGLELADSSYGKCLKQNITMLRNMDQYFEKAPLEIKQKIIGSMFPSTLDFLKTINID